MCVVLRFVLFDNMDDEIKVSFSGEKWRNIGVFIFYLVDDVEIRYGCDFFMKLIDVVNK